MAKTFDSVESWFNKSSVKTKKSKGAGGGSSRPVNRTSSAPTKKANTSNAIKATASTSPPSQVMVKISGSSKGGDKAQAHLDYIGRKGEVEIENESGEKFKGDEQKKLMKAWQAMGMHDNHKTGTKREALHIVFSMPNGTNPDAMKSAVKNTVEEEFTGHKYFIAQHHDTDNPHCHVLLSATDDRGARLNPRKADLHNYRLAFVDKLREQGIEATASRRIHRFKLEQGKPQGIHHRDMRQGTQTQPKPITKQSFTKIKKAFDSVRDQYKDYQNNLSKDDIQLKLDINKVLREREKELKNIKSKDKNKDIER